MSKYIKCKNCGGIIWRRYLDETAVCKVKDNDGNITDEDVEIEETNYLYTCFKCGEEGLGDDFE